MPLPNFLIVGAMKAGTTALWKFLAEHPEVYMSPIKEPNFFAYRGEEADELAPWNLGPWTAESLEEYEDLFRGAADETALGEASHWHLYLPHAADRIQETIPQAKIIILLRNPVDRAYSHYMFYRQREYEKLPDFGDAVRAELDQKPGDLWHARTYIDKGYYFGQLDRYLDRFDHRQIKICLHEDLNRQPGSVVQDVFRFLGVDDQFTPDFSNRYSASGVPRSKILHKLLAEDNPVRRVVKPLLPTRLVKLGIYLKNRNLRKPGVSSEIRRQLQALYREDILRVERLIDRDLSGWLN